MPKLYTKETRETLVQIRQVGEAVQAVLVSANGSALVGGALFRLSPFGLKLYSAIDTAAAKAAGIPLDKQGRILLVS